MKQALIMTSYEVSPVFQVEDVGFPVAAPLDWVECPNDVTTQWQYVPATGEFIPPEFDSLPKAPQEV